MDKIHEDNVLIAEFMGYKVKTLTNTAYFGWGYTTYLYSKNGKTTDEVFYHLSWDWLKPVIDKIGTYTLVYPEQVQKVRDMSIIVTIQAAYDQVSEIINWFNTNGSVGDREG